MPKSRAVPSLSEAPRSRLPWRSRPVLVVLVGALLATAAKIWLAATTVGTNDVVYWQDFARGEREFGPIGMYGHAFIAPYNHGPATGWLLAALNALADRGAAHGLDLVFLLRMPATLADLATALLVLQLVALARGVREAVAVALGVVWCPVLLSVSGHHGNTDPVFVMLVLLATYWLVCRPRPAAAGVAVGLAVSLKLVPVVVLPWLAFLAARHGWRALTAFAAGGSVPFVLFWVPVLVLRWEPFRQDVIGYRGVALHQWGIPQLLDLLGRPEWTQRYIDAGAVPLVLACAALPFAVGLRRRRTTSAAQDVAGVGLSLVAFLVLSSAFGMQYLAWAVAAVFVVHARAAWGYWSAASVLAYVVYSHWNADQPFWRWEYGDAKPLSETELLLMALTWLSLAVVLLAGVLLPAARRGPAPVVRDSEE